MTIQIRSDETNRWRQYQIIEHNSVTIVDMTPAILCGWNFGRVTKQGGESWEGMSEAAILAFKADDRCARPATDDEAWAVTEYVSGRWPTRSADSPVVVASVRQ